MNNVRVVIGKPNAPAREVPYLETFGAALVARDKQLITTKSEGVAKIIADAYAKAGGTPQYMNSSNYELYTKKHKVIAFTDTKYEKHLDEVAPDWRDNDWIVISGLPAIREAATFLVEFCEAEGTPIGASS